MGVVDNKTQHVNRIITSIIWQHLLKAFIFAHTSLMENISFNVKFTNIFDRQATRCCSPGSIYRQEGRKLFTTFFERLFEPLKKVGMPIVDNLLCVKSIVLLLLLHTSGCCGLQALPGYCIIKSSVMAFQDLLDTCCKGLC